ncbi:peptidoglycan recognition protein 3-like [Diadema setosum]|uniref:peptidoglycan recognition protein 3-like n=1 Tax=Diadema setosum TaxID=31175 RepID=UPI003B3B3CCA
MHSALRIVFFLCLVHSILGRAIEETVREKRADTFAGCPNIITREEWGARSPVAYSWLSTPTRYALVHHTAGSQCYSQSSCESTVRGIQDYHMDSNGWWDIGYNFLIGGDGNVYEGRGWDIKGAHAGSYNSYSIGISMMGTFTYTSPSSTMMNTLYSLLDCLESNNKILSCYTLYGHRQASSTECPGEQLYDLIQSHAHWSYQSGSVGNPDTSTESGCPNIVSRNQWGARSAVNFGSLNTPTRYAIVHHTVGSQCSTRSRCESVVRGIQNYHLDTRGWWDIGYNFLIGGDGNVYEGRGWDRRGAHAGSYNSYSIGIAMIGDFRYTSPSNTMMNTLHNLLNCLENRNKLMSCYTLFGHRQASSTVCPGASLYSRIQSHSHWSSQSGSVGNPNRSRRC